MTVFTKTVEFTVACPVGCDSKIVKVGFQNGVQRYRCQQCHKYFRRPDKFQEGSKFPAQHVGMALQGYFDGQSYREAARQIGRTFRTVPPDESSVYDWVQGYARGANNLLSQLKVPSGSEWVCDEMVVRVGGKKYWVWNIMDKQSRYILSMHLSPRRTQQAAEVTFRKALETASRMPKRVTTDGLASYKPAIETLMPGVEHSISPGLDSDNHNNHSERLQGFIRDRDRVLRGLQTRESGQNYLDGLVIDYNLFRPHIGLGKRTPAEAAGFVSPFRDWQDVARVVFPVDTITRPDWQRQDERELHTKDFKVLDLAVAKEAFPRATRSKTFKSAFKTRRGI